MKGTLTMYVDGICPNFYYTYKYLYAPSRTELVNFSITQSQSYQKIMNQIQLQSKVKTPRSDSVALPTPVISALLLQEDCKEYVLAIYIPLLNLGQNGAGYAEIAAQYDLIKEDVVWQPYYITLYNRHATNMFRDEGFVKDVDYVTVQPFRPVGLPGNMFEIERPLVLVYV
jgi:hypothetical protein